MTKKGMLRRCVFVALTVSFVLAAGVALDGAAAPAHTAPATVEPVSEVNVWLCHDAENQPSITCGAFVLTQIVELPDDADTCDDDDDGDGSGCVAKPACETPDGAIYDPPCAPGDEPTFISGSTGWNGDTADLDHDGGELSEGLGAFELQVTSNRTLFMSPLLDFSGTVLDDTGRAIHCGHSLETEAWILFGCTSRADADGDGISGEPGDLPHNGPSVASPSELVRMTFQVQPDVFQRIRPTRGDTLVTTIGYLKCAAADIWGTPYEALLEPGAGNYNCSPVTLTIRRLEGDVDLDCDVDIGDIQVMAFRYGAVFGVLSYAPFYDLEPNTRPPDFDIDIKDLQFVLSRNGSTCESPVPLQEP